MPLGHHGKRLTFPAKSGILNSNILSSSSALIGSRARRNVGLALVLEDENGYCIEKTKREETKREAIFTVHDAESAVITYTILGFVYIVGIFIYKWITGWESFLSTLVLLDANYPRFNRAAIALIIFTEGVDIMFRRYREWCVEHAERLAKAEAAGRAEGLEQGRTAGIAEAYQEIAAWNARRLEAEAKGFPFDEPPPGNGTAPPSKEVAPK